MQNLYKQYSELRMEKLRDYLAYITFRADVLEVIRKQKGEIPQEILKDEITKFVKKVELDKKLELAERNHFIQVF